MQGWNKQFLLKRRGASLSYSRKQSFIDEQPTLEIQAVNSHLRKMLVTFFTLKLNAENMEFQQQLKKIQSLQLSPALIKGDQKKIIKILYRRIQNILLTFGKSSAMETQIDKCYIKQVESQAPCSQVFIREVQAIILGSILNLRKKRRNSLNYGRQKQNVNKKQKEKRVKMRQVQNLMINRLYNILDISRVEVVDYFIEGVDIDDNITLLYRRQKPRNKIIRKQIAEYADDYESRLQGKLKDKKVNKKQVLNESKSNSKVSPLRNLVKEKKSKSTGVVKNKILLKPITGKSKKKLKIIR